MPALADDAVRTLQWRHGSATLQRLGAMLAPVVFRAPGRPDFAPMQVAPWAGEPGADGLPGILRRLRGDWPCVPFGRTDRPHGLPAGWSACDPGDAWGHGYPAHHEWRWLETGDPLALALTIEPPPPLRRLTRVVRAVADAPALDMALTIEAEHAVTLPAALHPTLRLDLGRTDLELPPHDAVLSYPVDAEPGVSRLRPDAVFGRLAEAPAHDGRTLDLTRFPQAEDSEELLQVRAPAGPVCVHYPDAAWRLSLDWDRGPLPDVMLWISHRGRAYPPWNGRHLALGIEPVAGVFDLGRVAMPPPGHGLAHRVGLALSPDAPLRLRHRLVAEPIA